MVGLGLARAPEPQFAEQRRRREKRGLSNAVETFGVKSEPLEATALVSDDPCDTPALNPNYDAHPRNVRSKEQGRRT